MKAIYVDYVSNLLCLWAYAVRFFSGTLCARETEQCCESNAVTQKNCKEEEEEAHLRTSRGMQTKRWMSSGTPCLLPRVRYTRKIGIL